MLEESRPLRQHPLKLLAGLPLSPRRLGGTCLGFSRRELGGTCFGFGRSGFLLRLFRSHLGSIRTVSKNAVRGGEQRRSQKAVRRDGVVVNKEFRQRRSYICSLPVHDIGKIKHNDFSRVRSFSKVRRTRHSACDCNRLSDQSTQVLGTPPPMEYCLPSIVSFEPKCKR